MRRLRPLCLTLAGLAWIAPSIVRAEDPPGVVYDAEGRAIVPNQKKDRRKARNVYVEPPVAADGSLAHPPRLCAACAARMMQQGQMKVVSQAAISDPNAPAPVMVAGVPSSYGPTTAHGAGAVAAAGSCATCGHGEMMPAASAPGYASVGGGTPGLAYVGQEPAGSEPSPVGVVRASYGNHGAPAPGTLGASVAGQSGQAGTMPYARPDEMPPSLFQAPTPRRHHILAHILGIPTGRRMAAEKEAQTRSAHAMISYGSNGASAPSELPASMVYGGK